MLHQQSSVSSTKIDPLKGVLFLKPSIHYKKKLDEVKSGDYNKTVESFSISSETDGNSTKAGHPSSDILINNSSLNGWFWHPELEWIYIDEKSHPYFYLFSKEEWILIFVK